MKVTFNFRCARGVGPRISVCEDLIVYFYVLHVGQDLDKA